LTDIHSDGRLLVRGGAAAGMNRSKTVHLESLRYAPSTVHHYLRHVVTLVVQHSSRPPPADPGGTNPEGCNTFRDGGKFEG
jgi:hypothetical protein